ncbi:DsbA family oxidoreductase [Sodalis ligni]|uniref:DsbA family oxidoreductase n=1 Tax=Sodalis ligni TaxID=2697027 RepID=UPI00193F1CCE|nr:DsbA family oxidoreductase [Sodalis ligni]QWA10712.1 DsbA family oxidoreductase [Sodalis ligni]
MNMLKIDFVSDVSCPWCIIGLQGLEKALADLGDEVKADIVFHPFELNPGMPAEGQNLIEHVGEKYGSSPAEAQAGQERVRQRAQDVGFIISVRFPDGRIYNTFDAHRLLHWARLEGRQHALKRLLFTAYFTDGQNPSDRAVLLRAAEDAGLDAAAAAEVLDTGRYAEEVRADEHRWLSNGVNSVPTIVIDNSQVLIGGQPAAAFRGAILAALEARGAKA